MFVVKSFCFSFSEGVWPLVLILLTLLSVPLGFRWKKSCSPARQLSSLLPVQCRRFLPVVLKYLSPPCPPLCTCRHSGGRLHLPPLFPSHCLNFPNPLYAFARSWVLRHPLLLCDFVISVHGAGIPFCRIKGLTLCPLAQFSPAYLVYTNPRDLSFS